MPISVYYVAFVISEEHPTSLSDRSISTILVAKCSAEQMRHSNLPSYNEVQLALD
jgi:hypothetical protein